MNGCPLLVVAGNLGHMRNGRAHTAEVERTYGHLSQDYTAQALRDFSPKFSVAPKLVAVA